MTGPEQSVNVYARNEVNGLHMVGEKVGWGYLDKLLTQKAAGSAVLSRVSGLSSGLRGPRFNVTALEDAKAGIGGAVAFIDATHKAIARIADSAVVKAAGDVNVLADAEDRQITVTSAKGTSQKLAVFGSGGIVLQETYSLASIEDKAAVDAGGDLNVLATNDPRFYNIAGAVAKGASTGIGASVSLNDVTAITKAYIGNGAAMTGNPTLTFKDVTMDGDPTLTFKNVALTGTGTLTFADNELLADKRDTMTRCRGAAGSPTVSRPASTSPSRAARPVTAPIWWPRLPPRR